MPAVNPAGYQNQDLSYEGRPYINLNPSLDALGEFTDPEVYRKLKYGGIRLLDCIYWPGLSLQGVTWPVTHHLGVSVEDSIARTPNLDSS